MSDISLISGSIIFVLQYKSINLHTQGYWASVWHMDFSRRHIVIRFMWVSAKFGTCTVVVSVNGTLVEAKMCTSTFESTHLIFTKCPIYSTLTTVQVPNLALVETKRITVQACCMQLQTKILGNQERMGNIQKMLRYKPWFISWKNNTELSSEKCVF
jgi:hypothetical protein